MTAYTGRKRQAGSSDAPCSKRSAGEGIADEGHALIDCREEAVECLGISRSLRVPIDDECEVGPAIGDEHASGNAARVKAFSIGIAALGIDAGAGGQGDEVDVVA